MEINGLPLHVMVVHGAVVFGPLAALAAVAYAVPAWRDRARWPMVVAAVVAAIFVVIAYLSGEDFRESMPFFNEGALSDKLDTHESRAELLLWITLTFSVLAVVTGALHWRTGAARFALTALLVTVGLATLTMTVLTGDAGAQAVWGQ